MKYDKNLFSKNLKKYRKAAGYTSASKFASVLLADDGYPISENTYKSYESGKREPGFSTLIRIVEKLGISLDDLFRRETIKVDEERIMRNILTKCLSEGQYLSKGLTPTEELLFDDLYPAATPMTGEEREKNLSFCIKDPRNGEIELSVYEFRQLNAQANQERRRIFQEKLNEKWKDVKNYKLYNENEQFLKIMANVIGFPWNEFEEKGDKYITDNYLINTRKKILFFYYLYGINLLEKSFLISDDFDLGYGGYIPQHPKTEREHILFEAMTYKSIPHATWIDRLIADECRIVYEKICKKSEELNLTVTQMLKYIFLEKLDGMWDEFEFWQIEGIEIKYEELMTPYYLQIVKERNKERDKEMAEAEDNKEESELLRSFDDIDDEWD